MYITLTVAEANLYTGWICHPNGVSRGLEDILGLDVRDANEDPDFDKKIIVLTEASAREIGILADRGEIWIARERECREKGIEVPVASYEAEEEDDINSLRSGERDIPF